MPTSSHIRTETKQNRSLRTMGVRYHPVNLSEAFPLLIHYPHLHDDQPISLLHMHHCWEIGCCYDGHGVFVVGSKIMAFSAGQISVIAPGEPHLAQSAPGTISRWAWIYFDPQALLGSIDASLGKLDTARFSGPDFLNLIGPDRSEPMVSATMSLVEEFVQQSTQHRSASRALLWKMFIDLQRLQNRERPARSLRQSRAAHLRRSQAFERLSPALQHIAQHYMRHLVVGELAQRCEMSEPHFRRFFAKNMGKSPQQYWIDLRIRMAASLLRSGDDSVLAISQRVGFETLSSFNRAFKQLLGSTPRAFRDADQ